MIVKCTFAMWLLNVCLITREISEEMIDCKLSLFHSRICKLFARIRAFSTRATLLLKYCCLQIFEKKRDCSQSKETVPEGEGSSLSLRKLQNRLNLCGQYFKRGQSPMQLLFVLSHIVGRIILFLDDTKNGCEAQAMHGLDRSVKHLPLSKQANKAANVLHCMFNCLFFLTACRTAPV